MLILPSSGWLYLIVGTDMTRKNKRNNGRGIPSNDNLSGTPPKVPSIVGGLLKKRGVELPSTQDAFDEKEVDTTSGVNEHLNGNDLSEFPLDNDNIAKAEQQLANRAAELRSTEDALNEKHTQLEARESAIQKLKESISAKQAELSERERALEERELDARNGFHLQNQQVLQTLKEQIRELESRRASLDLEIVTEHRKAAESWQKELESIRMRLQEREEQLLSREVSVATRDEEVQAREHTLTLNMRNREELVARVRKQLIEEFSAEILAKGRENEKLKEKVERYANQVEQLRDELDEYSELSSCLRGRRPSELLAELDQLRDSNKQLKRNLREYEVNEESDEVDALRDERDQLEEQVRKLRFELEGAKQHSHSSKMVVLEREQWAQEKRILERTKQVLDTQINDLESRIGSLIASTQAEVAFPELVKMDTEHGFQTPRAVDQVEDLKIFTQELRHRIALAQPNNPLYFRDEELQLFIGGLAMSQLHVFQGISGTGKTSLAKAFAKAVGGECQDIAVQAGWRDRSDLLGHYNSFEKRFAEKECLQALYRAVTPSANDRINIMLLDEMNLSRPEQYFADFLSALEKEPGERWIRLVESQLPNAPTMLQEGREIRVPENLWFIGTANQDETTNELADKTHDRAFVLELPRHEDSFQPNKAMTPRVYSFSSLNEAFRRAQASMSTEVKELLRFVSKSDLSSVLEKRFGIGWGNRFERQALKFMPVVKAAGGSLDLALDHLLSSRIFRNGKVTGRYDVSRQDLEAVQDALMALFERKPLQAVPERSLAAIQQDIQRLERGA